VNLPHANNPRSADRSNSLLEGPRWKRRDAREHADLPLDVVPVSRSVPLDETVVERLSHFDDPVGHALDLGQPLGVERLVTKDGGGDSGAMDLERRDEDRRSRSGWLEWADGEGSTQRRGLRDEQEGSSKEVGR
jgi:hypothetical protein